MASKRETVLAAVKALVAAALPGAEVKRNPAKAERIPPGGLVVIRDGDPGEPEVGLSPLAGTANGGAVRLIAIEQELTLTGAFVDATTAVIADRMIVLGVASRTTQAITGATSYGVGVAGNASQFGGFVV